MPECIFIVMRRILPEIPLIYENVKKIYSDKEYMNININIQNINLFLFL